MREEVLRDTRLLDALEYIDDEYIASAARYKMKLKTEPNMSSKMTWRTPFKYWKQFVALAACLILLAFASPIVNYVVEAINFFAAGWGSGTTEETSTITETDTNEYIIPDDHIENAPYFIFTDDLEPISAEKMDEVKNAWYQIIYNHFYDIQYRALIQSPIYANDKEELENTSSRLAKQQAEEYKDMLFGDSSIDHFRCRYYATLNGYVIFAFNTYLENEYNIMTVGNVTISNPTSFYIFAYGGGEIILLEEAYANKRLSASDISVIGERHNAFNDAWIWENETYSYLQFTPELEPISDEKIKEIRAAIYEEHFTESYQHDQDIYRSDIYSYNDREAKELAAKGGHSSGTYYSELFFNPGEEVLQYYHRYYGTINDCAVLVSCGEIDALASTIEIAGYSFTFSTNYSFKVFVDGGFIAVDKAYENGLLSASDIRILHERHLKFTECFNNYQQYLNQNIIGGLKNEDDK